MSVPDNGFELDDGSWTLNARARILSTQVYAGENALELQSRQGFGAGDWAHGTATATMSAVVGRVVKVRAWVYPNDTYNRINGEVKLHYAISTAGDAVYDVTGSVSEDDLPQGWSRHDMLSFTPSSAAPLLKFYADFTGTNENGVVSTEWYVDLVEDGMAIKLSERAIDALVATLQANLATELTAIDTDRGDGITMTAPADAAYHKFPKGEIAGDRASVEVFEAGGFEFTNKYTDHTNQRAVYTVPLIVRITWFNETGGDVDEMYKRGRCYASGVKIVLVKNPRLEDDDDAIQGVTVGSYQMHHETQGEDSEKVSKSVVTMNLDVDCEEIA